MNPFHLAIPVHDVDLARDFYLNTLGCIEGRSDTNWVDFNFFGHQLVCHKHSSATAPSPTQNSNPVDQHDVPIPHFGVVLSIPEWEKLAADLSAKKIEFIIQPYIRFKGLVGEQATMFFTDPSGNAIEIKAFKNIESQLFAS